MRSRSFSQSVMTSSFLILFPLTFASNIFVDPATMPPWLRTAVSYNPVTHLVDASRGMMHGGVRAGDVLWVLVASAIFQLATGLANAAQWYPWREFSFRTAHYALAWVAIGALVLHVAVKLPVIRAALGADVDDASLDRPGAREAGAVSRRVLLRGTWAAAGVAVLATAGGSVPWLRRVSVLAVRTGEGPGGVPINKTAAAAGVLATATDPGWALDVRVDGAVAARLSLADLRALPQHTVDLPIACVEGWSAQGRWSGVRVRDVLAAAGAAGGTDVVVTSLQERGPFIRTVLPAAFADDERSLLALDLADAPLDLDHGFPCRVIAPNRPGVLQTKWVSSLEVST